jgi:ABC-type enterochelin transport system ATPase subunit
VYCAKKENCVGFYLTHSYHDSLDWSAELHFNADPEENSSIMLTKQVLSNPTVQNVKMTNDFIQNELMEEYGSGGSTKDELLEQNVYDFILFDGTKEYNNLDVSNLNQVHITYQLCGIAGRTFRIALYANHQLLSDGTESNWEVTLKKGEVATLDVDIDITQLDQLTTIYAIAVPVSDTETYQPVLKTLSLLLYR